MLQFQPQAALRGGQPAPTASVVPPDTTSNAAMLEALSMPAAPVTGVLGRMFNAILGRSATDTSVPPTGFTKAQLETFVKHRLQAFADDWALGGAERAGAVSFLLELCDKSSDDVVSWAEFQAFSGRMSDILLQGGGDVATRATAQFQAADKDRDGRATFEELEAEILRDIVAYDKRTGGETAHRSQVAELSALTALFVTSSQTGKVEQRTVTLAEWVEAAKTLPL